MSLGPKRENTLSKAIVLVNGRVRSRIHVSCLADQVAFPWACVSSPYYLRTGERETVTSGQGSQLPRQLAHAYYAYYLFDLEPII